MERQSKSYIVKLEPFIIDLDVLKRILIILTSNFQKWTLRVKDTNAEYKIQDINELHKLEGDILESLDFESSTEIFSTDFKFTFSKMYNSGEIYIKEDGNYLLKGIAKDIEEILYMHKRSKRFLNICKILSSGYLFFSVSGINFILSLTMIFNAFASIIVTSISLGVFILFSALEFHLDKNNSIIYLKGSIEQNSWSKFSKSEKKNLIAGALLGGIVGTILGILGTLLIQKLSGK